MFVESDMLFLSFSYILWVCLLNKCEISNSYCSAITRFGIKQYNTINFNSDLKLFFPFKCRRKYYQCIPKKRKAFRFQSRDSPVFTDKRLHTWRPQFAFSALFFYLYRVKQYNQILKTFAFHV